MEKWKQMRSMYVVALFMAMIMTVTGFVPRVEAGFVPSDESYTQETRTQDMQMVKQALEQKQVRERLEALGYTPQEIDQRLAQLSDQEVHKLASKIDTLNQGGVIGLVIGVLVIVILVIVVLKLTDKRITVE